MNTDCEEETSKFFMTVYGQFVKDLCYSECSDFEAPVKIFMATFPQTESPNLSRKQ